MCLVSRAQKEIKGTKRSQGHRKKSSFKARLAVAEGEFPQCWHAWRRIPWEAGGTCITELGVPWKIYEMRMSLKISDGCGKFTTFISEYFEMGALPWDPVLKSVEI